MLETGKIKIVFMSETDALQMTALQVAVYLIYSEVCCGILLRLAQWEALCQIS